MKFTKSDLKVGQVVELQNQERYFVLKVGDYMFLSDLKKTKTIMAYNHYLVHDLSHSRDIVKVYNVNKQVSIAKLLEENTYLDLIWDRNEKKVQEISLEEATKLLKHKFPDCDELKIIV